MNAILEFRIPGKIVEHPTGSQQDDRPRQRINEPVNDVDTAPLAIEEKDRSFRDNRIRNRRTATLGADKDRSERKGEQYLADKTVVKTGWADLDGGSNRSIRVR